jgi:hypothetical protein
MVNSQVPNQENVDKRTIGRPNPFAGRNPGRQPGTRMMIQFDGVNDADALRIKELIKGAVNEPGKVTVDLHIAD